MKEGNEVVSNLMQNDLNMFLGYSTNNKPYRASPQSKLTMKVIESVKYGIM